MKKSLITTTAALLAAVFPSALSHAQAATAEVKLPPLPEQVPHLAPVRPKQSQYCVNTGAVFVLAESDGRINYFVGPDFRPGRAELSQTLALIVDGKEFPATVEMKRARRTGVFYGIGTAGEAGDIRYRIIDHGRLGDPWHTRSIVLENTSPAATRKVALRAKLGDQQALDVIVVKWHSFPNRSRTLDQLSTLDDAEAIPRGLKCGNGRFVIAFTGSGMEASTASLADTSVTSAAIALPPAATRHIALVHYAGTGSDADRLAAIAAIAPAANLAETIAAWQKWFDDVPTEYKLERIDDPRARDLVEGGLAVIMANRTGDGGFMATPSMYLTGYIRDSTLGLRGLLATGHFEEIRQWLIWLDYKYQEKNTFANHWHLASTLRPTGAAWNPDKYRNNFEGPALCVLLARDYHRATGDLDTLKEVLPVIRYCIDVQLQYVEEEGTHALLFHGDETEFVAPPRNAGLAPEGKGAYSYPSTAFLAGALEFYIDLLKKLGQDPANYENSLTGKKLDLRAELAAVHRAIEEKFWRTDLPEAPEGFHDSFRRIEDDSLPDGRIPNFILQPIYLGCPFLHPARRAAHLAVVKALVDPETGITRPDPRAPDNAYCGHVPGYFLYCLAELGDPAAADAHKTLVHGPTADWIGGWNEAYKGDGTPFTRYAPDADNCLRTMETGVNIDAIARYWRLGRKPDKKQ